MQDFLSATVQSEPTQADRRQQRPLLASLYLRYISISNRLTDCVDQIVQPQKRALARKILEAVLGRILELKIDLVEADLMEWTHCGDTLKELNVTPAQVELRVPNCFRDERRADIEYKKKIMENVLAKLGFLDKVSDLLHPYKYMRQAIGLIQS